LNGGFGYFVAGSCNLSGAAAAVGDGLGPAAKTRVAANPASPTPIPPIARRRLISFCSFMMVQVIALAAPIGCAFLTL
jgi:hypothetical protein